MAGPLLSTRSQRLQALPPDDRPPCPGHHTDILIGDAVWRCEVCLRYVSIQRNCQQPDLVQSEQEERPDAQTTEPGAKSG